MGSGAGVAVGGGFMGLMMSHAEAKTRLHSDASRNEWRKRGRHARPRADNEAISIAHYTTEARDQGSGVRG